MESSSDSRTGAPPPELVEALAAALERERSEQDAQNRARILTGARAAIEAWRRGRVTTAQAVLLVRIAARE